MTENGAIQKAAPAARALPLTKGGVEVHDTTDMYELASKILKSGIPLPQTIKSAADLVGILLFAHERGLPPIFAAQNIAQINGKLTMYGDAIVGLVRSSGKAKRISEFFEGKGDELEAVCQVERKDIEGLTEFRFSVADAKSAKLWGKAGPWAQYPKRMLQMRARGFAMRDAFADVLGGIITREEAEDYPKREAVNASQDTQEQILNKLDDVVDVTVTEPAPAQEYEPGANDEPGDDFFNQP